jgi:SAM-dependent methyltransferase
MQTSIEVFVTLPIEVPPFISPRLAGDVRSRVLDIGAADGRIAGLLAGAGYDVVALEIDVDLARLAATRLLADAGTVVVGDGLRIPFRDSSFDGALLIEVAEHLHDTEALLREIHRALAER